MSDDESDRTAARRRVEGRRGLILNVVMYLVCNAGMFAVWAISGAHYPWFLWPMIGWGLGIIGHAFAYFFGPDSPNEQRAVARELDRMHRGSAR